MHSVCPVCIFCYWGDDKDQNKNDFLKSGTNLGVKYIYIYLKQGIPHNLIFFLKFIYIPNQKILIKTFIYCILKFENYGCDVILYYTSHVSKCCMW